MDAICCTMGSKKNLCNNAISLYIVYIICIPFLVTSFLWDQTQKSDISTETHNMYENYENITYDVVTTKSNELIELQSGKLPEWQNRSRLNFSEMSDSKFTPFRQVMTQLEYEILMGLLRKLKQLCDENGLTYMLCGGSVLGTYRHAGFVPWDDDVDVWLDLRQMEKARTILNNTAGIMLHQSAYTKNLWKMSNGSKKLNKTRENQDPRFPYIDVYFFTGNATHIYDSEDSLKEKTTLLIDDVFPVRKVLYEDEEFCVPNKMLKMIERMYGRSDICTSQDFTHLFYIEIKNVVSVPCEHLYYYYPFVTRSYYNSTLIETLGFLNKTIRKTISNVITENEQTNKSMLPYRSLDT
ncbi:uncharacterized protein LOC128556105 [Mercenaria mercenaria]|uniref:uncharacterized protein LOC128556105 n=1 Tax=Mercenaria mercenaria TaxID=6596 RepID=UPI00234EEF53|nr:uncharacterized protein LOC128556105 [Mercenaria mercenaria]